MDKSNVALPWDLLKLNHYLALVRVIFFVNMVLFLVTLSRDISLTTIKYTTFCTAKQLASNLIKLIKLNKRGVFTVRAIFMDNELKKVVPEMQPAIIKTTAVNKHMGEIECRIWVNKERSQCRINYLPFKCIPNMWMKNFP